jgi:hypothetical protein
MDLKQNHLAHVRYIKQTDIGGPKGEITERVILPTYIPTDSVKALDVSHLGESEALMYQKLQQEYAQYVEDKMSTVFNFEDWISHTYGDGKIFYGDIKHRTFKLEALEVIKSE